LIFFNCHLSIKLSSATCVLQIGSSVRPQFRQGLLYFLRHRLKYFQKLFKTTEGNKWEAWVAFFLNGIILEMTRTLHLFNQIIALYDEIKLKIPMLRKRTVFFLFQNPIFSSSSFRKAKGDQDLLKQLKKLKFLKKRSEKYYFFPLLRILKPIKN